MIWKLRTFNSNKLTKVKNEIVKIFCPIVLHSLPFSFSVLVFFKTRVSTFAVPQLLNFCHRPCSLVLSEPADLHSGERPEERGETKERT